MAQMNDRDRDDLSAAELAVLQVALDVMAGTKPLAKLTEALFPDGVAAGIERMTAKADERCGCCGEPFKVDRQGMYLEEVGEFWDDDGDDGTGASVLAHAQCGLDAELELA